jgi:hypothetical protein
MKRGLASASVDETRTDTGILEGRSAEAWIPQAFDLHTARACSSCQHESPREKHITRGRISLTFRQLV